MTNLAELTEDFWNPLLSDVSQGAVIPVIGHQMDVWSAPGQPSVSFANFLARVLAREFFKLAAEKKLRSALAELEDSPLLGDESFGDPYQAFSLLDAWVAVHGARVGGLRLHNKAFFGADVQLNKRRDWIPPGLAALAALHQFRLVVTLSPHPLCERAFGGAAPGGGPAARIVSLGYQKPPDQDVAFEDLPPNWQETGDIYIYHLFGRYSESPDHALGEADLMEFISQLNIRESQPKRLFEALGRHHLMLLGCGLPDWLLRFLVRAARGLNFRQTGEQREYVAESRDWSAGGLAGFLEAVRKQSSIVVGCDGTDFALELLRLWQERQNRKSAQGVDRTERMPAVPKECRMFVSYASEDLAAAEGVARTLEDLGVTVFFDKWGLEGGDDFNLRLEKKIADCHFFVPLMSANTLRDPQADRFFRKEWNLANERRAYFVGGAKFILPVALDAGTHQRFAGKDAAVPNEWYHLHCQSLAGAPPAAEFRQWIVNVARERFPGSKNS